jgi:hypothetical protein
MHESAEKSECVILGRWFLRKSDRFLGTGPHYGMRQKMGFPPTEKFKNAKIDGHGGGTVRTARTELCL